MKLDKGQLEELTKGYKTPEEMSELYAQMLQHMINRSLAELSAHLEETATASATGNYGDSALN